MRIRLFILIIGFWCPLLAEKISTVAEDGDLKNTAKRQLDSLTELLPSSMNDSEIRWHRERLKYVLAVGDKKLWYENVQELDSLYSVGGGWADDDLKMIRTYQAAHYILGAKHHLWPGKKMKWLKKGLPILDSLVQDHPREIELRYMRLMSCYYLPFFIGREETVREDFIALSDLFSESSNKYPVRWLLGVAKFVIDKGKLPEEKQSVIKKTLQKIKKEESLASSGES